MEGLSGISVPFIIGCYFSMTFIECQKSQHLVLSESRKTGLEGTPLQVNCTAHVTSPLYSLKWVARHESQSDIEQAYPTNTTVVMTIASLHGSDAGRYKCLLVLADGREETAEFELMVRRKGSNSNTCSITQFKCKKTKHCIFLRYRCDGKDDCGDGSDEDCEGNPCLNKFRCNNSRCVDNQMVCDHIDNCGDLSDEGPSCEKIVSTAQPTFEDSQFGWLKMTVSTIIASTVGAVILISFIIIMVFRMKMKRQREQRIAQALESLYRHGESREARHSGHGDESSSDQCPFLPSNAHHYGNIIVNVNNGVQYLPGYDYSLFVAVPPPYSECGADGSGDLKPPPPYSTIDHTSSQQQNGRVCGHPCISPGSRVSSHSCVNPGRQNISVSSVQSCLGGMRGLDPSDNVPGRNNETVTSSRARSQDLENLAEITPSFLQSLLEPHLSQNHTTGSASDQSCMPVSVGGQNCIPVSVGGQSCMLVSAGGQNCIPVSAGGQSCMPVSAGGQSMPDSSGGHSIAVNKHGSQTLPQLVISQVSSKIQPSLGSFVENIQILLHTTGDTAATTASASNSCSQGSQEELVVTDLNIHVNPSIDVKDMNIHVNPSIDVKDMNVHVNPSIDVKDVNVHVNPSIDVKDVNVHANPSIDVKDVNVHANPSIDEKDVNVHIRPSVQTSVSSYTLSA